jgi:hypothetical protein
VLEVGTNCLATISGFLTSIIRALSEFFNGLYVRRKERQTRSFLYRYGAVSLIDETMSILEMNYLVYGQGVERPRKAAARCVGRWS